MRSIEGILKEKRGRHRNAERWSLTQSAGGAKSSLRMSGVLCHCGLGKNRKNAKTNKQNIQNIFKKF